MTARYNESCLHFFPRVLRQGPGSAWRAEKAMLARRGRGPWHPANPMFKYAALQLAFLMMAYVIGGWLDVALFALQAFLAIWQLELTDYVEHYGLTRAYLGEGNMNPCVRAWRKTFYPEIENWTPYETMSFPPPRGAG